MNSNVEKHTFLYLNFSFVDIQLHGSADKKSTNISAQ